MKSSLQLVTAVLAATTIATTIPYQTDDMAGIVQSPSSANLSFSSVTGTWSYPTMLDDPFEGSSPYFFTQYIGMDMLPGTCSHSLEVGTNITLTVTDENSGAGINGGYGYYRWNNVITPIVDDNGNTVQFLGGDTVTVKIWLGDLEQGANISFNSTSSGYLLFTVIGGNLCQENVQWAVGSVQGHTMPYFEDATFDDCEAGEIENGSGDGAPDVATLTPVGGSLVYILGPSGDIDADPHCPDGSSLVIESQPDDQTGDC